MSGNVAQFEPVLNGQTLRVVEDLTNGIDPVTGKAFEQDSPYGHPLIISALFNVLAILKQLAQIQAQSSVKEEPLLESAKKGLPKNYGKPWSDEQLKELLELFNGGAETSALANQYERSESAIIAQLIRFGVFGPNGTE